MVLPTRFHIWFIMTIYYKMGQILLQNVTAISLQNATEVYYKMRRAFYYRMRQPLQDAMIFLQNATVNTICDVYCKLRQYTLSLFRHGVTWIDKIMDKMILLFTLCFNYIIIFVASTCTNWDVLSCRLIWSSF